MRTVAALLIAASLFGAEPTVDTVQFRHLCTYGSKDGIHPPRVSNKKLAVAATGQSEHPYGLGYPGAVTTDPKGRLWIADSGTISVHVFDSASGSYREFRKAGDAVLKQPAGITSDRQGRVYLVDSSLSNIFVFEEGEFARALFKPGVRELTAPTAIALSEDGRTIYVADPPRNVIVALNREGEVDATIPLTEAARDPASIQVINNQLYVLGERHHRVEIFSPAGQRRGDLQWDGIPFPLAFAYEASSKRFMVANPRLMIVEIFGEDGKSTGAFGQMGERVDQQIRIDAMHIDSMGRVYIVDAHHGKVLLFHALK